jgi:hypothetical protein
MLPNKFYQLTKDVKNPEPDRRKKSLDALPVWPAGTIVFHRQQRYPSPAKDDGTMVTLLRLEFYGQRSHAGQHAVNEHWDAYKLIADAVGKPLEEDFDMLLFRLDHSGRYLLEQLHTMGKVSLAEIEEAYYLNTKLPDL